MTGASVGARAYLERAYEQVERLGPVATAGALTRTLSREHARLGIPHSVSAKKVLTTLLDAGRLRKIVLQSKSYGSMERIAAGDFDIFDVAMSLKTDSYFSHGTAVFLHALTADVPTTIYLNKEQTPKPAPDGELTQAAVDRAFAGKGRRSAYAFRADDLGEVVVLSGKNTGKLEVGTAVTPRGRSVPTTNLERTLIDIAVRPEYAGGPAHVAAAYESAVQRGISSNVLLATLKRLDHKYPYHQSIGFYLERAGADGKLLDRLRALGMNVDFYAGYGMKEPRYIDAWRLYVPDGV